MWLSLRLSRHLSSAEGLGNANSQSLFVLRFILSPGYGQILFLFILFHATDLYTSIFSYLSSSSLGFFGKLEYSIRCSDMICNEL